MGPFKKLPCDPVKDFAPISTIAVGSTQQLSARLFETVAGVDTLVVPHCSAGAR